MMNAATTLRKFGIEQAFNYIYKDPEKNMLRIMDWADKFAGEYFVTQRRMIREAITNPAHPYYTYGRSCWIPHLPATFTAPAAGRQSTETD